MVKRIQLSGYRRLSYHNHQVSGDRGAYDSLNYFGQGQKRFTDFGQIDFTGRNVLGLFNFEGTLLDSRLNDPQGQRFSLDYIKRGVTVNAGDIYASLLNTNRFATVNKSLRGIQASVRTGNLTTKVLQSKVRGTARTISLQGANSAGPYYLQSNQILRGTERIQVDGVTQVTGTDYVIDYDAGAIQFVNRVIAPTSTIVATYEALGFGTKAGTLRGGAVNYQMGKAGRIGASIVQQIAAGGSQSSQRLEKFEGFGAPSTPYFLQFEPINAASVTIRVNGIIQTLGLDYRFDQDNLAVFYFSRFMPSTDRIDVIYTPKPRSTVDGDRQVLGLDYSIPLGRRGNQGEFSIYQATGRLMKTVTPSSGTARGAQVRYQSGKAIWTASVRNVPTGFVGIETTGFNRNEQAHDARVELRPSDRMTLALSESNARISTRSTSTTGKTVFNAARVTSAIGTATYRPTDDTRWTMQHARSRTNLATSRSQSDATDLTGSHRLGPIDLRLGLNRTSGRTSNTTATTPFNVFGVKLGASYAYRNRFNVSTNVGYNAVKSGTARGTARDYELLANFQPSERLEFRARYALADAGNQVNLLGYQGGSGIGFDGNGFSGGAESNLLSGASNYELWSLGARYLVTTGLQLDLSARNTRTSGNVSANAVTRATSIGLSYDAPANHRLNVTLDRSNTRYITSPLTAGATNVNFFLDGSPKGRFSYTFGSSLFHASGNSSLGQDSNSLFGNVRYLLNDRHSMSLDYYGARSSGYLPQSSSDLGLTYSYRIWSTLALNAGYRWRRVQSRDPQVTSGAYRSNGFDLTLEFSFAR